MALPFESFTQIILTLFGCFGVSIVAFKAIDYAVITLKRNLES